MATCVAERLQHLDLNLIEGGEAPAADNLSHVVPSSLHSEVVPSFAVFYDCPQVMININIDCCVVFLLKSTSGSSPWIPTSSL